MSGHDAGDLRARTEGGQLAGVLSKPFSFDHLRRTVREALGEDAAAD